MDTLTHFEVTKRATTMRSLQVALKVLEYIGRRHIEFGGDIGDRHGGKTARAEQALGGRKDRFPCFRAASPWPSHQPQSPSG